MAKQSNGGSQSTSFDAGEEIPAGTPTEPAAFAGEETAIEPIVAVEAVAPEPAEIVDIVSTPLALVEEAVESATEGFAASISFDSSLWSKKSLDLWAENAAAFFDLAEHISKAQSLEEIVDLQSRFAKDRFEAFLRQSKELMDFAKSMATLSAAPLCEAGKAA